MEFSETFIDFVENNGRSFELGLATPYHLSHHPLDMIKWAPMAMDLQKTDRYMRDSAELTGQVNTALAAGGLHWS